MSDMSQDNPQEALKLFIQLRIQCLVHACKCSDDNCHLPNCEKMKLVVLHVKSCERKTTGGCPICKQLIALLCYHAKNCQNINCSLSICSMLKQELNQEKELQQLEQGLAAMDMRGGAMADGSPPSVPAPTPEPIPIIFEFEE